VLPVAGATLALKMFEAKLDGEVTEMPLRMLMDAGVVIHAEFAEPAVKELPESAVRWSDGSVLGISGLTRKQPDENADYQRQKDALFTVGRLIRERKIEAYTYSDIDIEKLRGRPVVQEFNALHGCVLHKCEPPIERSRFRRTSDFTDFFAKGGKKDRDLGHAGQANQIAFFEWLCTLDKGCVDVIIENASLIGLNQFEVESLRNLDWFQLLCNRSGSSENYPDVFHLWTAERHCLDALLTLDRKLPRLVDRVRNEKKQEIAISIEVLRPLDLLQRLGISESDAVPINNGQFYNLYQL